MQGDATHELHVVVTQPQGALGCFSNRGEGLGEDVVQGFPFGQPAAELVRLGPEFGVGEGFEFFFQGVDLVHQGAVGLDGVLDGVTAYPLEQFFEHGSFTSSDVGDR